MSYPWPLSTRTDVEVDADDVLEYVESNREWFAEKLQGHLPDNVKEERANIIKQISTTKFNEFLKSNLNSTQEVLIEKKLTKDGKYKGVTRNYINVILEKANFNTLQMITLKEIQGNKIISK